MDQPRAPFVPVDPPRPVTLDLTPYGPRRLRWGVDTPVWVRAAGWWPERATPAVITGQVLSAFGDWWALCRVPLLDASGHQLADVLMPVPPEWVTTHSETDEEHQVFDDPAKPRDHEFEAGAITVLLEGLDRYAAQTGISVRTVLSTLSDDEYAEVQRIKAFVREGRPVLGR